MENYELLERVGEGTYGVVLKCRHKKSDTIVAVKRFKQSETNEYVRCTMMREVCVQRLLKGEPNVVQLLETFMENGKLFLVMEYFQGSLLNLLDEQPDGLDLDKLRLLIYTLITGVHSCHSNGVVHRDIKPENILMKSDYSAYLCDFGFARPISTGKSPSKDGKVSRNSDVLSGLVRPGIGDGSMTVYVATRWYRSPEMLLAMEHYDYSVDMWAVGAIMAEAADGAPLLPGRSELEMISLIQERIGVLPADYQALVTGGTKSGIKMTRNPLEPKSHSPRSYLKERYASRIGEDGVDLLRKLLAIQATDRITAEEALCHPFFEKMAHQEKRTKSPVSLSNEREEGESICSESTSHSAKQDSPIMSTSTTPLQVNLTTVEEQSPKPTFNVSYGAKEECSKKRASLPTVLSPSNNVFHHSRIRSDELPFSNDKDGPSTHMSAGSPVTSRTSSRRRKPFKGFVNSSNNTLDSIYGKSRPPKHEKGKRASTAQGKRRESKTSSSSVKETALTVRTPSAVNTPKKKANRSKKVGTARYMSTTRRKVNKPSKSEKPLLLQELESLSHPVTAPNSTEVMEGTPNPKAANAARQHKEQQLGSSVHSGSESAEREHHAVTIEKLTDEGSCSALSVDSQTECGAYEKKMRKMQEMGMEDSVGPVEPPNRGNVFFRKRSSCSPLRTSAIASLATDASQGLAVSPFNSDCPSPSEISPMNFNSRPTPQLCRYTTLPNSPIANAKLNPRTSLSGRLPTVLVPLSNTKEELKHLNSENSNLGTRSDATPREEQPMPIQCNSPPGDSIPHFVRNTSGSSLGRRLSASHSTKPPISQSMSTNPMPRYGRLQPLPFQDDVPADDTSNGGSQRSLADVYRFNQQHSSQKKKGRLVLGDK